MLAAAVTLTNFAQAEVTGKAVPPTSGGGCPNVPVLGLPGGVGSWSNAGPLPAVVCIETIAEYRRVFTDLQPSASTTLTTATHYYIVERRVVGSSDATRVANIVEINPSPPPPDPTPPPDPNPTNPPDNNNGNMDDGNTQMPDNMPDNTPPTPQTPAATVQAKSSNDAKRLAQYGAAGFAAFVLIHNYWLGAPLGVLPLNMAYNEKGAIFSGTSFRISPQETIHLSALESVDDKRGEYKFGVQWHYQFAPPRGLTETPAAALPAIYTMPNVTPKDWLKE